MGRYDSPLSIATLFLAATVVSVGLIFLFDAETESRLGKYSTTKFPLPPSSPHQDQDHQDDGYNSVQENEETSSVVEKDFPRAEMEKEEWSTVGMSSTTPGSSRGLNSIIGYFGGRLKDLFKRHHRVKRRIPNFESDEDEDDIPSEPLALPLQLEQFPVKENERIRGERRKREIYFEADGRNSNNGNGVSSTGDIWKSRSSDQASPSPLQTSSSSVSSSVGFHKIRHAMKKLGGGGLDLSMVERMILDPNPGRFRGASTENQEPQPPPRKSNYHHSPHANGHDHNNNDGLKSTNQNQDKFDPYYHPQLTFGNEGDAASTGGGESSWDSPMSSNIQSTGNGGKRRKGKSSMDNDDDNNKVNENINSFEPERRRASSTSTTILPSSSSLSSGSGGGRSQKKGNRQKDRKKSSSFSSLSPSSSTSPSLAVIMEDSSSDFGDSSDFDDEQEDKEKINGKRRKTNDVNSRTESSAPLSISPFDTPHSRQRGEQDETLTRRASNRARGEIDQVHDDQLERVPHHKNQQSASHHDYQHVDNSQNIGHHHHPIVFNHDDQDVDEQDGNRLGGGQGSYVVTDTKKSILKQVHVDPCYKTDDVLIVVAITCCLNFAFVLVIWGCVRWFSISSTAKERDFHHLDCEDGGDSILFHEEQDHEDCCWRASSPLGNFRRDDRDGSHHIHEPMFERSGGDSLDLENINCRHHHHCIEGMRKNSGHGDGDGKKLSPGSKASTLFPTVSSSLLPFPSFQTREEEEESLRRIGRVGVDGNENSGFRSSLRRKPSDRFHFFRQKQYQKNLKEFGLGFGPPLTSADVGPSSSHNHPSPLNRRLPKTSASLYSFQKVSDVPHHHHNQPHHQMLQPHLNSTKSYSHSMEDLRYIHT